MLNIVDVTLMGEHIHIFNFLIYVINVVTIKCHLQAVDFRDLKATCPWVYFVACTEGFSNRVEIYDLGWAQDATRSA